jgi:hypothetical protein
VDDQYGYPIAEEENKDKKSFFEKLAEFIRDQKNKGRKSLQKAI